MNIPETVGERKKERKKRMEICSTSGQSDGDQDKKYRRSEVTQRDVSSIIRKREGFERLDECLHIHIQHKTPSCLLLTS